jgi:peroxiredoxin
LGFEIVAASADRPEKLNETLDKNSLTYRLVSDASTEAAQAFGLAFQMPPELVDRYKNSLKIDLEEASGQDHHVLPVPAIYLIDREGIVQFSYVNPNYRVRLEPSVVLAAARAYRPKTD